MRLVNLYKILESSFDCPNPLPNMNHHNLSPSIQTFWYKIYNCMSTEAHMSILLWCKTHHRSQMWERGSFGNPQLILSAIMSFKWDFSFIRLNTTLSHFFVRKATVTPRRDNKGTRPETFSGRVRDIYTWETNIFLSSAYNNNTGKWSFHIFLFLYLFIWHVVCHWILDRQLFRAITIYNRLRHISRIVSQTDEAFDQ